MDYRSFRSYLHTIIEVAQVVVKIAVYIDSVLPPSLDLPS